MESEGSARELGLPHLLLLLLAPLVPPFLSGALRAALADELIWKTPAVDVPLPVGLVVGGLVTLVGLGWVLARAHVRSPKPCALIGIAALLLIGTVLVWRCLYNGLFDGLVSVGGGDAGSHLVNRLNFLASPRAPKGSATFYAVTYWAERAFALDAFGSFRLGFYVIVAAVLVALAASVAVAGRDAGLRPWAFLLLLFGLVTQTILFPLLHYMQAEGFYNQLFALVPLFVCWATYGLGESPSVRLLVLAVWVVATRYTYGLNVGDALVTASVLAGLDAYSLPPGRRRRLSWALAFAFLAAAPMAYAKLVKYWDDAAGVTRPFMIPLLAGEALLAAALGLLTRLAERANLTLGSCEKRLARFACVVGCINVVPPLVHSLSGRPFQYVLLKYSFAAVALLAAATVVLVPFIVPGIVRHALRGPARSVRRATAAAAVVPTALLLLAAAYQPYLRTYVERMRAGPPWKRIGPLADREGLQRIAAALRSENLPFAGLLGASWPVMHFMNAALGEDLIATTENWEQLAIKSVQVRPGCVFWYAGPEESSKLARRRETGAALVRARLRQLDALPDKRCESYPARWDPSQLLELCHWCDRRGP